MVYNNKKLVVLSALAIFLSLPIVSLAVLQLVPPPGITTDITGAFEFIFTLLWMIFAAFSVISFLIAGFLFLASQGESSKVAGARQAVIWGVVGVIVGLLAFSIPFIIKRAVGV